MIELVLIVLVSIPLLLFGLVGIVIGIASIRDGWPRDRGR